MRLENRRCLVFSAHAEVVPSKKLTPEQINGILRARGGSSMLYITLDTNDPYSPRTRR